MIAEESQRFYQGDAGRRYQTEKRGLPPEAVPWVARLRAEKLAARVQPTDCVLEYGVGQGWNLAALKCRRKIGFDVADFLRNTNELAGIEFITDTAPLAAGIIDVVLCHHTLEHVPEPAAALREMRRLLAPGGRLLLFVPFETGVRYLADEPNHHLYSWTPQTLGNLATANGFRVTEAGAGEFGYDRFAAVRAVQWHLGETGFRLLRRLLHLVRPLRETRVFATPA